MKKNNVKTTERKQRKQAAAGARRKRRVSARNALIDAQVKRQLRPISQLLKQQGKQIEEMTKKLATNQPPPVDTSKEQPSE